jgi:glycosyltransferase involved in cell wall biosynthesis
VRDRTAWFVPRPSAVPRVLFVGALRAEHGADLFLRAAAKLVGEGLDLEALLTGDGDALSDAGPSYRAAVARQSAEVRRRVRFLGETSEDGLFQALADCDLVCLPYRVDAAAVPCLEALMFGRAVVAADLPSIRDILGGDAPLFLKGDADALADRLRELLTDEDLRGRLGRQGRRAYDAGFAFSDVLDTTLTAYTRLVTSPGGVR